MQKKSLLMALAVPALFAACSQEEVALAPNNASGEFQGKPLEGVTIGFNQAESADTKMANSGWNLQWKKGDQVGLVWTNAYEITKQLVENKGYDPLVYPGTPYWGSNTRMTCTNPDGNIFEMQDGQVLEGQYFAYYPYQEQTYQMNGKFSVSVDREQHQGKVSTADPAANLSYVKDHMVWVSRAYQQESKPDAATMNPATFLYPLTKEQAGMSKSIDITMNRFANMLDTRIRFTESDRADVTTNPADVVIEKVVLRTVYGGGYVNDLAVSGEFDMSKLCKYVKTAPYGLVPMAGDKNRVQLALSKDNGYQVGVFEPDRINSITTVIDYPEKVDANNSQRVNFLLLPYTNGGNSTEASLQLVIYTNYGVAYVPEADWYYNTSTDGLDGLEVWGPNTQPTEALAQLKDGAAESNLYKGWARRIGAHFTRWISVNVADLKWQTRCVSNQEELVEAIRQYNTTGKTKSEMKVCVDVENLVLSNFNYSENSNYPAVRTFIANGNTLVIDDEDGHYTDAEHKITWKGNSTIGAEILTDFQENVAANATLNVVANHRVNGGMLADATSTINIEPAVELILGAKGQALNPFELNGKVNVKAGNSELGKLLIGAKADLTNNGTIELFGKLQSNNKFTNGAAGNINLYTTATIEEASINNYGLVNYYYAKAENMKNFTVTNVDGGQYLATYDNNKVPETNDTKEIAFLNEANNCGVTHYVIAKVLNVESKTVNMSKAESIVVNNRINITANPSSSDAWLQAKKATLYFKGTHTINVTGNFANTAKFQVLNIVMAYNGYLTNNAIIEQQKGGKFSGEEDSAGNAKYTVDNKGSIYGGTLVEQTGTITWKTKKYGVK